jgi:hypothetical protein
VVESCAGYDEEEQDILLIALIRCIDVFKALS